jgi:hypothetical protein
VAFIGLPFALLLAVAIGVATGVVTVAGRGAGTVAGEGEEHVVQGRLAQGQVLERDAGGVQPAQRLAQRPGAIGRREHDPAAVLVIGWVFGLHGLQRPQRAVTVVGRHGQLQHRTAYPVLELVGHALADKAAVVDDGDPVGELVGLLQVLGGQQHGGAGVHQLADQRPQVPAAGRVQPGSGLVQEQHLRAADQAGGQVEPSAHAARVGLDLPVGGLSQADARQQLAGAAAGLAARQAVEAADQLDVFPAGEVIVDRGVLASQPDAGPHLLGMLADIDAGDAGAAGVGWEQGGQDADQGCLAGPVGAEQAVDTARFHG